MSDPSQRRERRPIISGIICLGIGLYLASVTYDFFPAIEKSWPILLVILGIALIVGAFTHRKEPPRYQNQQPLT